MPNIEIGTRFGKLTVVAFSGSKQFKYSRARTWLCQCDCGQSCTVPTGNLRSGNSKSCGCEKWRGNRLAHGESIKGNWSPEYRIWSCIVQRIENPQIKAYPSYGGRGITMHPEWRTSFEKFRDYLVSTIGRRPEGMTLDRIDNDKGYEPNNLRWATPKQQANNRRPAKKRVRSVQ